MLKLYKLLAVLLLMLTVPAHAQMSKSAIQNQIVLNWPDNNKNTITAQKLRVPNQIIVNSYLDLNGATSFQCPANQVMIGFTTLSTPSCNGSSTGTGGLVFANSPVLVTPNLGTPSAIILTNGTSLPIATGVSGLGTGTSTALGIAVGTAGSVVTNGGALGTPSSGVGTNLTALNGTNVSTGTVANARLAGSGVATVAGASCTLGATCGLSSFSNSIGAGVNLSNTTLYFDGPSIAQGTTGTWFASGTVAITSTTTDTIICKLWDGTTVADIAAKSITTAGANDIIALSGIVTTPAANIRISCKDASTVNGAMSANADSVTKASTVSAFRIN